jgi:hypothetical protein
MVVFEAEMLFFVSLLTLRAYTDYTQPAGV